MSDYNLKDLGTANPGNSLTLLYSPSGVQAVGNLKVANASAASRMFTVAIIPNGATILTSHYIAYNTPLLPNQPGENGGICLQSGDAIWVSGSTTDVTFNFLGQESPTGG